MPNCADGNVVASNAVENDIRSSGDDQFSHAGFGTNPAQIRVSSQRLDECDDPGRQASSGVRFVESYKGMDFSEPRSCERGPDNFDR